MPSSENNGFWKNIKEMPLNFYHSLIRHGAPTSDRTRSQAVFTNFFLHIHSTRAHPNSLRLTATWGLGVSLISQFIILTITGILLMVYYVPSLDLAYDSIKDLHYVVPAGRLIRNAHRWAAHMMVLFVFLHMARGFYTSSYKSPREFNWLLGIVLFVLTLALSLTGYFLPWDQLGYWALLIVANILGSANELIHALGLPQVFHTLGNFPKELFLGSNEVGQDALIRFYMLHVMLFPILISMAIGVHIWRIRKDGGLGRPEGTPVAAGKGVGTMSPEPIPPEKAPSKTYGLMAVIKGKTSHTGLNPDETVSSWPYLLRAELLIFMINMLICLALAMISDAPLKEPANPSLPENPAKAPWYFLGIQELLSYSAFVGGTVVPGIALLGLALVPFLDRENEPSGVWFSGPEGKRITLWSMVFAAVAAILTVVIPVNFGWLREWFPQINQLFIIAFNPGSILTAIYAAWSIIVMRKTGSTRMGALALFSCFLIGFTILTYVGTFLRGPNWGFYWSTHDWPAH